MINSLIEAPFIPVWARAIRGFFFIYNGASMAPLFRPGDLLCARRPVWKRIRPGDVVIIALGNNPNHFDHVVHRVVSVKQKFLITQGDNNLKPDMETVTNDNIIGLVIAFGRQGHIHPVRGGILGLTFAGLIHSRNIIWFLIKRIGWRVYRPIQQSGLVARVWRPDIYQIRVMTDKGPLVKYRYRTKTVARWWPQLKHFDVVKPFDLVIPKPE
jgi:hypothetical protein